jgi:hypothetical protein
MNKHQAQYLLKHASALQKEAVNVAGAGRAISKGLQSIKKLFGYGDEAAKVVKPPRKRSWREELPHLRAGTPVPPPRDSSGARHSPGYHGTPWPPL